MVKKKRLQLHYMQTKGVLRSVEHVFHECVLCCLEWPLLFSLSASADKKWASCLQKSLSFYPFVLGSQTAGKVRQVHPFLLAQGNPFWWDDPSILLVTRIVFMVHENLELFIIGWLLQSLPIWPLLSRCRLLCLAGRAAAVICGQITLKFIFNGWML